MNIKSKLIINIKKESHSITVFLNSIRIPSYPNTHITDL